MATGSGHTLPAGTTILQADYLPHLRVACTCKAQARFPLHAGLLLSHVTQRNTTRRKQASKCKTGQYITLRYRQRSSVRVLRIRNWEYVSPTLMIESSRMSSIHCGLEFGPGSGDPPGRRTVNAPRPARDAGARTGVRRETERIPDPAASRHAGTAALPLDHCSIGTQLMGPH